MIINEILQNAFSNIERDVDSYIEVNGVKYGSKDFLKDLKVNIKADKDGIWIGRAIPKMLNAEIINNGITINAGDEIKPYFGVKVGDTYQYINVGTFYAQNPEYTEDRKLIKIVAYDKLKAAQTLEYGAITYPVTVTKVVDIIASKLRLTVDKTNLLFLDYNIEKEVYFGKDKTVIELINAITQMSMTFAYLDYDNVLKFKRPNKITKILNDDNVFKFRFKDYQKQYNAVVISRQPQNDDVAIKVDNNQLENIEMKLSNNPILDLNREFFITDLLNAAKVIPAFNGLENLTMQSNPLLEVGDLVTFRAKDVVILEHEITMTRSMLKSQIAEMTETDYKKSKGLEDLAVNTELYVDKAKNEIVATIGDEVGNKLTELKLDESGITQRVESVFEANKDSLSSNFSWNLLTNSHLDFSNANYSVALYPFLLYRSDAETQKIDNTILKFFSNTLNINQRIERRFTPLKAGKYTYSLRVRISGTTLKSGTWKVPAYTIYEEKVEEIKVGEWQILSITFDTPDQSQYQNIVRFYLPSLEIGASVEFDWEKLEQGTNSNPAWAPHLSELKGMNGIDGKDGADGTSVKILGTFNSTSELPKSNNVNGDGYIVNGDLYVWTGSNFINVGRIQGPQGERGPQGEQGLQGPDGTQGIQGPKGIDGKTSYTHIAYANNETGTIGFSLSDSKDKTYIGMYADFIEQDSTDPNLYKWTLIKGLDGKNGIQGPAGEDGKTPYLHIAYANDEKGTSGFSVTDSLNKLYIGQYTDYIQEDSDNPSVYNWTLIKGSDGNNAYLHIAYADSADGKIGFTTSFAENKTYIGMYSDNTLADSTDPTRYKWSLIKGNSGSSFQWNLLKGTKVIEFYSKDATTDATITNNVDGSITIQTNTNKLSYAINTIGKRYPTPNDLVAEDVGKDIVFSIEMKTDKLAVVAGYLGVTNGYTLFKEMDTAIGKWHRVWFTAKVSTIKAVQFRVQIQTLNANVQYRLPMLHYGVIPTPWAPHITEIQGVKGDPGEKGESGQDAYIPSTSPPSDTSKYWMDLNDNKLKYFDKTTNTWKDVNWQLEERIQSAESKVTDSAIIDKVTKSEQWTTLSDKANASLDATAVQKKIDEFSTNELTSDKLMTKISNTTTWTDLNSKVNSKLDSKGVNTAIKGWADQTLTTSYFNTQLGKTTGFTDLSGKYTDVEKRTASLELNLKDFQLEFNKETDVNLNLISRTEDFSKGIPEINYISPLFAGANGTLLRLFDPGNSSVGNASNRWEFRFNREVKLTGQTFWLSLSAKASYSVTTKVKFRLIGGDGTWSNAELLGDNLGDYKYIRLKVDAPNSGATCRGIYVNIYNTAGVSQNAIEIQSKTLKCEIGRGYTAWTNAETDEIKGANYYFGLDGAKFIYNNEDVLKVDPTNGLYIKGNGEFAGKLSATSGDIAGWSINNGWLRANGNNGSYVQLDSRASYNSIQIGNSSGTTFIVDPNGNVSLTGKVTASSGKIANWEIGTNTLTATATDGTYLQLNSSPNLNFIQVANKDKEITFSVEPTGNVKIVGDVFARNGEFSGKINAASGSIGGFDITANYITGPNGMRLSGYSTLNPISVNGSYINGNGYGSFSSGSWGGSHSGTGSFSSGSYTGSVYSGGGTLGGTSYSNDSGLSFSGSIWVGGLSSNGTVRGATVSSSSFTSGVRNGSGQLVTATLNSSGWSISNSDIRLKENIEDLGHEFDNFIYDLPLIKYNYIGDEEMTPQAGVNANYLMKILPEYMAKSFLHQDKNTGLYGAKYELLVPYMIKTIQDLNSRLKELEVG